MLPLFLIALGLTLSGCVKFTSCTEIGCAGGFTVDFRRPSWDAGTYRVTVVADGETTECTATLPFVSCNGQPPCPGSPKFLLNLSGCALPPSQHAIAGLTFPSTQPASVTVSVHKDGNLLGEQTYAPRYTTTRPNGPDCEPVCTGAPPETLALP
jgi:hypothetical protein